MPAVVSPLLLWPVLGSTTANKIRVKDLAGVTLDVTVTMAAAEYLWTSGDADTASGEQDLSRLVLVALNSAAGVGGISATLSFTRSTSGATHRFTYTSSENAQLLWSVTGTDRFPPALVGFTTSDTALGTTHAAPNQPDGLWAPARPYTLDTRKEPRILGALARSLAGVTRGYALGTLQERTVRWQRLTRPKVLTEYAAVTEPRSTLQRCYEQAAEKRLRLYDDEADQAGGSTRYQRLVLRDLALPWKLREGEAGTRYDAELRFAEYLT